MTTHPIYAKTVTSVMDRSFVRDLMKHKLGGGELLACEITLACKPTDVAVWARGYGSVRDHFFGQHEDLVGKNQPGANREYVAFANKMETLLATAFPRSNVEANQ